MNRLINFIGAVVLCGILFKLSCVFVYLFGELDGDGATGRITGVTFAFASVYFVVKVRRRRLKITMVALDVLTILYFYLHERIHVPVDYSSVIVAAYSGLIVYYLGKTIGERLAAGERETAARLRELEDRQSIAVESRELEDAIERCRRRLRQSRREETRRRHEQTMSELEKKLEQLNNQ